MTTTTPQSPWDAKIAKLSTRKPAELTVTIPDDDAVTAIEEAHKSALAVRQEARRRLDNPTTADIDKDPEVVAALANVRSVEAAAADKAVKFRFRQLPPDVYDHFALRFPPTKEQEELGMAYNVDEHIPALIAACSVDPIEADRVKVLLYGLRDDAGHLVVDGDGDPVQPPVFNQGEAAQLFAACRTVNEQSRVLVGKD